MSFSASFFKGTALFGLVRSLSMQNTKILLVFVVVVVATAFLVAFLLVGRFVRLGVRMRVVQCDLETFAEILETPNCPGGWHEVLDLHLLLPADQNSKLQ